MPSESQREQWRRHVWAGPVPQLTVRAVVTGMAIGGVLSLSNLYVTLKTGWSLGVTLVSAIAAFGVFQALFAVGLVRQRLQPLENVMVASVASSAAFMTGGGNMAALPALLLLTGERPAGWLIVLWFATIASLGAFLAVALKRPLIDEEQLPFPSSVAAAHTIAAMHAGREDDPSRPTRAPKRLAIAAIFAGLWALLRDLKPLPFHAPGSLPLAGGLAVDLSPVLLGGGALMPWRTAAAVLLGALVAHLGLAPWALAHHWVAGSDYRSLLQFNLWPGAGLMVASGVVGLALQWHTGLRALQGLMDGLQQGIRQGLRSSSTDRHDPEAPLWWFAAAVAVLGPLLVVLMSALFGIPWWLGLLSLPVALVLGAVAARVTGETDVTPSKALGPVTQLMYGALRPGALTANLMGANVTGGVGLHAADTLGDLKCGWVLGATPKLQLWAQLFGITIGALAVVPAFNLLVPSAAALGTAELPAPAVQVWASVSRMLVSGVGGLPAERQWAAAAGAAVGTLLTVAEAKLPRRWRTWLPSPTALGIAFLLPGPSAVAMFVGATLAALLRRRAPELDDAFRLPVASGLVAGESLMGMALVLLRAAGRAV